LLAEKVPLLILAAIAALLAYLSQQDWGALGTGAVYSAPIRIENALVSYAVYFRRVFWPTDLAIFYPHPGASLPLWKIAGASVFLVATTLGAFAVRRRAPYLLAGWFWFGLALGPVIGLIQIGAQAMADRYAYPSIIGIFIALVWAGGEMLSNKPRIAGALAAAAVAGLAVCASFQTLFFRDSETIFRRTLAVTSNNDLAHLNLGCALLEKGDFAGARENFIETIRLSPRCHEAWKDLAFVENSLGHDEAAAQDYAKALQIEPDNRGSLLYLGRILAKHGRTKDAEALFLRLRELEPDRPEPCVELGDLYAARGRWNDATTLWTSYLAAHPADETGQRRLAAALAQQQTAK
jgi:Flp pilus assembly protein TadD